MNTHNQEMVFLILHFQTLKATEECIDSILKDIECTY